MATTFRIATFNLENFDDPGPAGQLATRIALMRPQLERLRADVLCLQEVNTQNVDGVRTFAALDQLTAETPYAGFQRVSTTLADGSMPLDVRNLVVLSRFPITSHRQIRHEITPRPAYRRVTAIPPDLTAIDVTWERPILLALMTLPDGSTLQRDGSSLQIENPDRHPWAAPESVSVELRVGLGGGRVYLSDEARGASAGDADVDR